MTKKALALLLSALMLLCIPGCRGDRPDAENDSNTATVTDTSFGTSSTYVGTDTEDPISRYFGTWVPTEETVKPTPAPHTFPFPYRKKEFIFLNAASVEYMYVYLDPEVTGDILDDACALRNVQVESELGVVITEHTQPASELAVYASNLIMTGDDRYDAMYIQCQELVPMVYDNLFCDLKQFYSSALDKPWWDQNVIERNTIDDQLYFATSDLNFMAFDSTWVIYYDEDLLDSFGLESPHRLVKDGVWTLAALDRYAKTASSLDGDMNFTFSPDGNATYGIVSAEGFLSSMMYGFGMEYATREGGGRYRFNADSDDFTLALESVADLCSSGDGRFIFGACQSLADDGYCTIFWDGRALFMPALLRDAHIVREMERNFGILPMPKYNTAQKEYESPMRPNVLSLCIPKTNANPTQTMMLIDYLTYSSHIDVVPRYYEAYSPLRSSSIAESRQCLEIIRDTRGFEASVAYGWADELRSELDKLNISGTVAHYRDQCMAALNETYKIYPPKMP